jgi:hypothetical protein
MYIQSMNTMVSHEAKKAICSTEEMRQDEHFEARIDDGDFIEVKKLDAQALPQDADQPACA